MRVLSHRGYWREPAEKNTPTAFERSFALGFGTETDLRDRVGELVISHDRPGPEAITADDFAALIPAQRRGLPFALNIKADGLADLVAAFIERHRLADAFVFDMSVPDIRGYLDAGVPVLARQSEVEPEPAWLERSAGVWLDGFESEWWDREVVLRHLGAGRRVCVVSPELHGRPHQRAWDELAGIEHPALSICSDVPEEAAAFFGGGA